MKMATRTAATITTAKTVQNMTITTATHATTMIICMEVEIATAVVMIVEIGKHIKQYNKLDI